MSEQIFPISVIRTGTHTVTSICFLRDDEHNQLLVSGTSEGAILVWNIITQSILCSHTFPDGNTILRCSRIDDSHFITHSRGSPVVVWHLDNSSLTHLLAIPGGDCHTFCQAGFLTGDLLLAQPQNETISLVSVYSDFSDYKPLCSIKSSFPGMCTSLRLYEDGKVKLLIGSESGTISLHVIDGNQAKHKELSSLTVMHGEPVLCLDYNPQYDIGLAAGSQDSIHIMKIIQDQLTIHRTVNTSSKGFNCVRLRNDCKLFVACSWDRIVRLLSGKKGTGLVRLDFHRENVNDVAFDKKNRLITASKDGTLAIWNLYASNFSTS